MDNFKIPGWLVRNPLGIIALFISLIYGMSAILLGVSIGQLTAENQSVLVWFVVTFPVAILLMFSWLVACHHKKLYGPGDFRSDESFLNAAMSVDSHTIGARLIAEVAADDAIEGGATVLQHTALEHVDLQAIAPPLMPNEQILNKPALSERVTEAYLLEGLVFQELQKELNGSVLREVEVTFSNGERTRVDGVIQSGKEVTAIEVVSCSKLTSRHRLTIGHLIERFQNGAVASRGLGTKPFGLIIVFVLLNEDGFLRNQIIEWSQRVQPPIQIRWLSQASLLEKYGIPRN